MSNCCPWDDNGRCLSKVGCIADKYFEPDRRESQDILAVPRSYVEFCIRKSDSEEQKERLRKMLEPDCQDVWRCEGCGEYIPNEEVQTIESRYCHVIAVADENGDPEPSQCGPVNRVQDARKITAKVRQKLGITEEEFDVLLESVVVSDLLTAKRRLVLAGLWEDRWAKTWSYLCNKKNRDSERAVVTSEDVNRVKVKVSSEEVYKAYEEAHQAFLDDPAYKVHLSCPGRIIDFRDLVFIMLKKLGFTIYHEGEKSGD